MCEAKSTARNFASHRDTLSAASDEPQSTLRKWLLFVRGVKVRISKGLFCNRVLLCCSCLTMAEESLKPIGSPFDRKSFALES